MQLNETVIATINTPLGFLLIETSASHIYRITFSNSVAERKVPPLALMEETKAQLQAYFQGSLRQFDLPLSLQGTAFQKQVWNELQSIPYASTSTYLQLAKRLGNTKSIRAAAAANGKNPIVILIPCHRVIGANGALTGYAGGLQRKRWLLDLEAKTAGIPSLL